MPYLCWRRVSIICQQCKTVHTVVCAFPKATVLPKAPSSWKKKGIRLPTFTMPTSNNCLHTSSAEKADQVERVFASGRAPISGNPSQKTKWSVTAPENFAHPLPARKGQKNGSRVSVARLQSFTLCHVVVNKIIWTVAGSAKTHNVDLTKRSDHPRVWARCHVTDTDCTC